MRSDELKEDLARQEALVLEDQLKVQETKAKIEVLKGVSKLVGKSRDLQKKIDRDLIVFEKMLEQVEEVLQDASPKIRELAKRSAAKAGLGQGAGTKARRAKVEDEVSFIL